MQTYFRMGKKRECMVDEWGFAGVSTRGSKLSRLVFSCSRTYRLGCDCAGYLTICELSK